MPIGIVIDEGWEISTNLNWAIQFADSLDDTLVIYAVVGKTSSKSQSKSSAKSSTKSTSKSSKLSSKESTKGNSNGGAKTEKVESKVADFISSLAKKIAIHIRGDIRITLNKVESPTEKSGKATGNPTDSEISNSGSNKNETEKKQKALDSDTADQSPHDSVPHDSTATSPPALANEHSIVAHICEVADEDPSSEIKKLMRNDEIDFLLIPRHFSERGLDPLNDWELALFRSADCAVGQLRPTVPSSASATTSSSSDSKNGSSIGPIDRVFVAIQDNDSSVAATKMAFRLSSAEDPTAQKPTAIFVQPQLGDYSKLVGENVIARVIKKCVGSKAEFQPQVIVSDSVSGGLSNVKPSECDLLILGDNNNNKFLNRRWSKSSVNQMVLANPEGPAVLVLRNPTPLTKRIQGVFERFAKDRVPQLERDARISLVDRIQSSTYWDFDFITLISLSTLIAAMGLVQNSGAVVIGAMLVAPLMTPLLGAGLAIVHGNKVLMIRACSTVFRGFLLAFFLGVLVGLFEIYQPPTDEMLSRGSPNFLDLIIAFVSGLAAAYAIGRPNLFSALPGVAIAAALVPPVATAGLGLAQLDFQLAIGALLLFFTNIVAIMLAAAFTLWLVGVRDKHEHSSEKGWTVYVVVSLFLIASIIGIYQLVPHRKIPAVVRQNIEKRVEDFDANLESISIQSGRIPNLKLRITSKKILSQTELESIASSAKAQYESNITVEIQPKIKL